MNTNPYASPAAVNYVDAPLTDAEAIRKRHLSHEASVKSIGSLYMLGAILMVLGGGGMLVVTLFGQAGNIEPAVVAGMAVVACFYLGLGILQGATAMGLRKLQKWARSVAVVFSVIGLIAIPIGTIISAYFLYLLLSQKGKMVFSEECKQIIAATPHIKYKTSIIVVILLILLVVILVFSVSRLVLGG